MFDSKHEKSVYSFGSHSIHNGQLSHKIPWSAELPPKIVYNLSTDWLTKRVNYFSPTTAVTHSSYATLTLVKKIHDWTPRKVILLHSRGTYMARYDEVFVALELLNHLKHDITELSRSTECLSRIPSSTSHHICKWQW